MSAFYKAMGFRASVNPPVRRWRVTVRMPDGTTRTFNDLGTTEKDVRESAKIEIQWEYPGAKIVRVERLEG